MANTSKNMEPYSKNEQIIQLKTNSRKKQGVGKDNYLGVFLETPVNKCLKITGTKIIFLEKSLTNTYEIVHFQITRLKHEMFHDFAYFLEKPILSDSSEWLLRDDRLHLLVNQPNALQ